MHKPLKSSGGWQPNSGLVWIQAQTLDSLFNILRYFSRCAVFLIDGVSVLRGSGPVKKQTYASFNAAATDLLVLLRFWCWRRQQRVVSSHRTNLSVWWLKPGGQLHRETVSSWPARWRRFDICIRLLSGSFLILRTQRFCSCSGLKVLPVNRLYVWSGLCHVGVRAGGWLRFWCQSWFRAERGGFRSRTSVRHIQCAIWFYRFWGFLDTSLSWIWLTGTERVESVRRRGSRELSRRVDFRSLDGADSRVPLEGKGFGHEMGFGTHRWLSGISRQQRGRKWSLALVNERRWRTRIPRGCLHPCSHGYTLHLMTIQKRNTSVSARTALWSYLARAWLLNLSFIIL